MFRNYPARLALLAGLLLAQLALVAFLYWPRASTVASGPLLPGLDPAAIERITLYADGERLAIARATDGESSWVLPDAGSYPVIEANVTQLISDIVRIDTSGLVATAPENHARLRVDAANPIRQVDLALAGGITETLYLGTSPTARATNVRRAGSDDVYLARDLSATDVRVDAGGWIDTAWLDIDPATVTATTLTNAAGSFEFVRDDSGGWTLDGLTPGEQLISTTVESLVSTVARLPMLRPLARTPQPAFGLDAPQATLLIETQPLPTAADAAAAAETITLTIGARDADDDSLAVQSSSSPWIVAVTGATLDPLLQATRDDFVTAAPPTPAAPTPAVQGPAAAPFTATLPLTAGAPLTASEGVTD